MDSRSLRGWPCDFDFLVYRLPLGPYSLGEKGPGSSHCLRLAVRTTHCLLHSVQQYVLCSTCVEYCGLGIDGSPSMLERAEGKGSLVEIETQRGCVFNMYMRTNSSLGRCQCCPISGHRLSATVRHNVTILDLRGRMYSCQIFGLIM